MKLLKNQKIVLTWPVLARQAGLDAARIMGIGHYHPSVYRNSDCQRLAVLKDRTESTNKSKWIIHGRMRRKVKVRPDPLPKCAEDQ